MKCGVRVLFLFTLIWLCKANTFYVSSKSNITEQCGTKENPCGTIQSGINLACASNSNDSSLTVLVAPGNYTQYEIDISCPLNLFSTNGSAETTMICKGIQSFITISNMPSNSLISVSGFTILQTQHFQELFTIFSVSNISSMVLDDITMRELVSNRLFIIWDALSVSASNIFIHNTTAIIGFDIERMNTTNWSNIQVSGELIPTLASFSNIESILIDSWKISGLKLQKTIFQVYSEGIVTISNTTIDEIQGLTTSTSPLIKSTTKELYMYNCTFSNIDSIQTILASVSTSTNLSDLYFSQISSITFLFDITGSYFTLNRSYMNQLTVSETAIQSLGAKTISLSQNTFEGVHSPVLLDFIGDLSITGCNFISCVSTNVLRYSVLSGSVAIRDCLFNRTHYHLGNNFVIPALLSVNFDVISSSKVFGSLEISNCLFLHNSLALLRVLGVDTFTLENTIFDSNNAIHNLIFVRETNLIISDVEFYQNSAGILLDIQNCDINISQVRMEGNHIVDGALEIQESKNSCSLRDIFISETAGYPDHLFIFSFSNCVVTSLTSEYNTAKQGGSVFVDSSIVDIRNATFQNNSASVGGVILSTGNSSLYVSDVLIYNCTASEGSGIVTRESTDGEIRDSFFINNRATGGGGVVVIADNSEIQITNVLFENNTALNAGCLLVTSAVNLEVKNCSFINCHAETSGGAVIASSRSQPSFSNCVFDNNYAGSIGSALFIIDFANITLDNVTITNNYSPNEGGGIYLNDYVTGDIIGTTFTNNSADSTGGALVATVNSKISLRECFFTQNLAGSKGGAIASFNRAILDFTNCTFNRNNANSGGVLYASDSTNQTFTDCSLTLNIATSRAGAIYLSSSAKLYFIHSTAQFNQGESAPGGAIFVQDDSFIMLSHSTFHNNQGTEGGAIYSIASKEAKIENCLFINNLAVNNGGAITFGESSKSILRDSVCAHNVVKVGGGCVAFINIADSIITNFTMQNNFARSGGALYLSEYASVNISESIIRNNSAHMGGGMFGFDTSTLNVQNSILEYNEALDLGGGAIIGVLDSFENVKFLNNTASKGGGAAVTYISLAPHILNCSFESNRASDTGGGIFLYAISISATETDEIVIVEDDFVYMERETNLVNLTFIGNTAQAGGGIGFSELTPAIPYFSSVNLFNNSATQFGGGIYFDDYFHQYPFMQNVIFRDNIGYYGGSSVGYHTIIDTSTAGDFCVNCSFPITYPTTSGYQNPQGFASVPKTLGFNSSMDPCPGSITLSNEGTTIAVFLFDDFGTTVTGDVLIDFPVFVMLNFTDNVDVESSHMLKDIEPMTGAAFFDNTTFCGINNSTVQLQFQAKYAAEYHSIQSTFCSVLLYGCEDGYKPKSSSTVGGCDVCVANHQLSVFTIILILLSIIFTLCAILIIILLSFSIARYIKKRRRDQLFAMEIPDFIGKPSLTLNDILNDPAIPRLEWEDVSILEAIGKGASGLVSRGIWFHSGKEIEIALKELYFGFQDTDMDILEEFLVEIKYMSALSDDNIVSFYGICINHDNTKLYLVTELMHFGSLRDLLNKKRENIPWKIRLKFAKEAAKGMVYLHSKKLIHRDLKPDNLLVNNGWNCKVADFGISTVRPTVTREMTCIGTPVYMAPEVLSKNKYSEKADVFSFGMVLWELFTGKHPYADGEYGAMNQAQLMYNIIEKQLRPSVEGLDPALQQLIRDCWNIDPKLRPSFTETIVRLRRLQQPDKDPSSLSSFEGTTEYSENTNYSLHDSVTNSSSDFDLLSIN